MSNYLLCIESYVVDLRIYPRSLFTSIRRLSVRTGGETRWYSRSRALSFQNNLLTVLSTPPPRTFRLKPRTSQFLPGLCVSHKYIIPTSPTSTGRWRVVAFLTNQHIKDFILIHFAKSESIHGFLVILHLEPSRH